MLNRGKDHLGTGWSFPPSFDRPAKAVRMVSAEDDICESLRILLSTSLGERVMQPDYGCNLQELLFEPLSPTVSSTIKELIRSAIIYHEPRIKLERLDLELSAQVEGLVDITIDYIIRSTNSRFSFVFPFYLQEGANTTLPT
ncbi:GPW/gp25 family protein [Synechococcus sp. PCC 7336]|uniref:GPW/gp25 family protein n=1 Tax=Synechococcus sp. PCC 7336 TaxID=195250 RepID=UPI0003456DE9|nr:GPW/gp25 family protein [Synechococcus sp. PCC 7336]